MNNRAYVFLVLLNLLIGIPLCSQSVYFPYDHSIYEFKERLSHVYQPDSSYHSASKKLFLEDLRTDLEKYTNLAKFDKFDLDYYRKEVTDIPGEEKGLFKYFYKNPAHLIQVKKEGFDFSINFYSDYVIGHEFEEDDFKYLNKRGLEFWGSLDSRFYFYTSIEENQSNFLNYIQDHIDNNSHIPGQGHFKDFSSSLTSILDGYDYANARAYLGYKTSKHSHLELGHGNHFIGNGIRSLLLSDYSHNYFYLSFNINVWKFNYQSIVSELSPFSSKQTVGNVLLPKKYMASHYLSFKPTKKLEIGLFETVVFARENQFEFQYLNPVILYRTVEALIDSPDNVLLGINANYRLFKRSSVYAQFLLDELKTSEIFSGDDWWGNKWAFQFGLKSYDLFNIKYLDLQLEYNKVRPYTYSHNVSTADFKEYSLSNYSHFNQPLAHPLGANFSEVIINLKYRLFERVSLRAQYFYSKLGRDPNDFSWGSNILLNNSNRTDDFGIEHLQGARSNISSLDMVMSVCLLPEFYIDIYFRARQDNNEFLENIRTSYWGLGLRYNIEKTNIDY